MDSGRVWRKTSRSIRGSVTLQWRHARNQSVGLTMALYDSRYFYFDGDDVELFDLLYCPPDAHGNASALTCSLSDESK